MAQATYTDDSQQTQVISQNQMETIEENKKKIQKIVDAKNDNKPVLNRKIERITKNTDRVLTGFGALPGEFIYEKTRKPVKSRTPYHIHFTKDLGIYYMTQTSHDSILSELIIRIARQSAVEIYNILNQQQPMTINPSIVIPTENQYRDGNFTRYFAKKTNDKSLMFEIAEKDFQTSPLYDYTEVIWFITGTKKLVKESNEVAIKMAEGESGFVGLRKILPDFQYYRENQAVSPKERIENKLANVGGFQINIPGAETSNQQQPIQQQGDAPAYGAGAQQGPPPGVMTRGAGGTGGSSY